MRVKDARQTFLGTWIKSLIDGQPIQVYGTGNQLRDFNYVDDCVAALLLAGSSDVARGKVYNLGSDEVTSLKDLAHIMVEMDQGGSVAFVPFPPERKAIDIGDYYGDFGLIRKELGWEPSVSLRQGLERTLQYFRQNRSHYWN
jgi:dTDP-glucose 4,6-dehydratase/UDP-glucose 4-epimerase